MRLIGRADLARTSMSVSPAGVVHLQALAEQRQRLIDHTSRRVPHGLPRDRDRLSQSPPGAPTTMAIGTIKRLVKDKGFGFIKAADGGAEYFFHRSSLVRDLSFDSLSEGERVQFEPEEGSKGPRAADVERA